MKTQTITQGSEIYFILFSKTSFQVKVLLSLELIYIHITPCLIFIKYNEGCEIRACDHFINKTLIS